MGCQPVQPRRDLWGLLRVLGWLWFLARQRREQMGGPRLQPIWARNLHFGKPWASLLFFQFIHFWLKSMDWLGAHTVKLLCPLSSAQLLLKVVCALCGMIYSVTQRGTGAGKENWQIYSRTFSFHLPKGIF